MLAVSYMGTKRHLAPFVAGLVEECKPGPFLDLFSGMCSVGQAVAEDRQVWSNDLQQFSHLVAQCQFCSEVGPPESSYIKAKLEKSVEKLIGAQIEAEKRQVQAEEAALAEMDYTFLAKIFEDRIFRANRIAPSNSGQYRLFLDRYAGSYFSLTQAIEIDAIRHAIDSNITYQTNKNWCLVALCSAMGRSANTTGHFAQALCPKPANISKVVTQRRRSIWREFLNAIGRLTAVGNEEWRKRNRAFNCEASLLLGELGQSSGLGVVYADPPYTADQYSRYYHLYETAILYDYPAARGRGLYRDRRAVSEFCHATKVRKSIERLVSRTAGSGADLILSYPSHGLLPNSRAEIAFMIEKHFGRTPEIFPLFHNHSTMGASKGHAKRQVTELVYRARK